MTRDGQAEAKAAVPAGGRAVRLAESIEDITQKLRGDPYAGVADRDLDPIRNSRQASFDAAAFVGELDCVGEEVPEDLLYAVGVTQDRAGLLIAYNLQGDPFRFGAGPNDINSRLKNRTNLDWAGLQIESARDET